MDSREFLEQVDWETNIYDVVLIEEETEESPAKWRVTVKPKDQNDKGADIPVEIDYYLIDNMGNQFRVIDNEYLSVQGNILVSDDFRVYPFGPQPDLTGLIVKSVGNGVAPHVASAKLDRLDKIAKDNLQNREKDILWKLPDDINEKWHPEGLVFTQNPNDPNTIIWTSGKIVLTKWPKNLVSDYKIENVISKSAYHPERKYTIAEGDFTCADDDPVFIYAVIPIAENELTGSIVVEKTYRFERYYTDCITILIGILNVPDEAGNRALVMQWGGGLNTKNYTVIDDRDTVINITENTIYYETTTQQFITYVNNEWIVLGKNIEFSVVDGWVVWRYIGDANWIQLFQIPADGADGKGIVSVTLFQTAGLVKTYRITFTDNTHFDYTVTDGKDGADSPFSVLVNQEDHGFSVGQCIKRNGLGAWILAKADNRGNAGTVGIVSEIIDENTFRYISGGLLPGDFVDGADYFLSTTTAGEIFIQSDPEVWEIGNVREFIGTGTADGLEVEIDLGVEISESTIPTHPPVSINPASASLASIDPETQVLTINEQNSGGGSFPVTVDSTTTNSDNGTTHTHSLGEIDLPKLVQKVDWSYLYNWWVTVDGRKITSSDDWDVPTHSQLIELSEYLGATTDEGGFTIENSLSYKVRTTDTIYWEYPNTGATNETLLSIIGSGSRSGEWWDVYEGEFWGIKNEARIWSKTEYLENQGWCLLTLINGLLRVTSREYKAGQSIRLIRSTTYQESLEPDGLLESNYVGNNGIVYNVVKLGNFAITTENLAETEWRDHSLIKYVPDNTGWVALTDSAYCIYTIPLKDSIIDEHNKLKGLQGGDAEADEFYHLTAEEKDKIQAINMSQFQVHIRFEATGAKEFECPYACVFTAMIHQQTNAPTLSTALNTNMAQYDVLTVTADAVGLVTLTGTWL